MTAGAVGHIPSPAAAAEPNPILALTPSLLHHVGGDARKQLINYLKHCEEHATLLRYLDVWLAAQPELATLRQARAETLLALGQPDAALHELDAIDEDRGASVGRRTLRIRALLAARDWEGAQALLNPESSVERGDVLMAQGRFVEAKRLYAEAAALREGPPTPREIRVALACGEHTRARAMLAERQGARGEAPPTVVELRLAREVATAIGDSALQAEVESALQRLELDERARLIALLGLGEHTDLEVVPDVPAMASADAEVPPKVLRLLHEQWGYAGLRGGQAATIARALMGQPTLAVLPTGAGKSLTYQLPALVGDGATVVVSPLIALMKDQLDGLPAGVRDQAVAINSTVGAGEVAQRLRDVRAGRYKLVYVAPERLRQQSFVHALRGAGIERFVVDEAHCVSLWGLSFRPDYLFLRRVLDELGGPPVLALTATATPETRAEIVEQLGDMHLVAASVFRSNLHFSVVHAPNVEAKTSALLDQCRSIEGPILVYARSRDRCEELAHLLRRHGVDAGYYHAQVDDRARAQEAFMDGRVRVLVATVAFGMGVDKPDIRAIIHYNLPQSVESYYQEAGRAGRDGEPARCVLLYTPGDKAQLTSWLRQDALTRDDLRAVYRGLRDRASGRFVRVAAEELRREIPGLEETQLRVALGMLERAGLLVRHFDLAQSLSVTLLRDDGDAQIDHLAAVADLRLNTPRRLDPLALALEMGVRPDQVEAQLLAASARGLVRLESGPRDLLLELLPAPPDTPGRIAHMLGEYATRQDARVEAMVAYAKGLSCRHRALAAHFGERLAACGDACDICVGLPTTNLAVLRPKTRTARRPPSNVAPDEAKMAALRALHALPYRIGRTGLAQLLVGSEKSPPGSDRFAEWGRLNGWTIRAAIALIDSVIDQGLMARDEGGKYPMLALTDAGLSAVEGE